jgi:hypothetical protein
MVAVVVLPTIKMRRKTDVRQPARIVTIPDLTEIETGKNLFSDSRWKTKKCIRLRTRTRNK